LKLIIILYKLATNPNIDIKNINLLNPFLEMLIFDGIHRKIKTLINRAKTLMISRKLIPIVKEDINNVIS